MMLIASGLQRKVIEGISGGQGRPATRATMETLYDLLGALPNDDADDLRRAFRTAVKGAHPDINPGDPKAALKFRKVVRANEILGDPDQRAAYDHLLELARIAQEQTSKTAVFARTLHRVASGVLAIAGFSAVAVGGYALFMHMSVASVAPSDERAIARGGGATEIVAVAPAERTVAEVPIANTDKPENAAATGAAMGPEEVSSRIEVGSAQEAQVLPPLDLAVSDARSYLERGIFAYRKGDLDGAIADFDQAIQLDPKFADAYIDRGITFYRLRNFERAFADIDRARQLQKSNRTRSAPAINKRHRVGQAGDEFGVGPFADRRGAGLD